MIHNERVYEVEVEFEFGDTGKLDVLDTHAAFMYIGFQEYESSLLEYLNDYRIFSKPIFHNHFYFIFFIRFQWLVLSSNEPVTTISEQISTKDKKDDSQKICDASENFGSKTHHSAYRGDSVTPRRLQNFQDNLLHSLQVVQKTHHQMQAATAGIRNLTPLSNKPNGNLCNQQRWPLLVKCLR